MDGLLDEASTRRMWRVAETQLHGLRQKVPAQGLSATPWEQRSQIEKLISLQVENPSLRKLTSLSFEKCDYWSDRNYESPITFLILFEYIQMRIVCKIRCKTTIGKVKKRRGIYLMSYIFLGFTHYSRFERIFLKYHFSSDDIYFNIWNSRVIEMENRGNILFN